MTVATQEPVQATPRTTSTRRWLLPLAIVILLALCIGGIILAFHWPFSSQKVAQSVQESWPGKIAVQSFHRTYSRIPVAFWKMLHLRAALKALSAARCHSKSHDPGELSRSFIAARLHIQNYSRRLKNFSSGRARHIYIANNIGQMVHPYWRSFYRRRNAGGRAKRR